MQKKIEDKMPTIKKKRVSPHTIRHTTATHLLQSGVDINTIRAWLGHVSINTTNIYAEVNMEMKAKALSNCEIEKKYKVKSHWKDDKKLMDFWIVCDIMPTLRRNLCCVENEEIVYIQRIRVRSQHKWLRNI